MPFISSRLFVAGGTKKCITLLNEEHVRYIGSDWTGIRIGMLCALTENGVSNITGRLAMGVCSGQTNPVGNATSTTGFVGYRSLSPSTWTYTANSGDPYYASGIFYGLRRVNNTDTTYGIGSTNLSIVSTAPGNGSLQRRSLIYVDLNKANGGGIVAYTANAQFGADYSVGDFLMGLEYSSVGQTPVIRGTSLQGSSSQTIDLSPPSAGNVFDCLDIHWSGTSQALEIYALGVYRKS